ncbi:MAG: hypothetical protein WBC49_06540 [Thermoplasmata archaeon]
MKHIDSDALAEDRRKKRMKDSLCATLLIAALTITPFVCVRLFEDNGRLCTLTSFVFAPLLVLSLRALRRLPGYLFEGCISEKWISAFHIFVADPWPEMTI